MNLCERSHIGIIDVTASFVLPPKFHHHALHFPHLHPLFPGGISAPNVRERMLQVGQDLNTLAN